MTNKNLELKRAFGWQQIEINFPMNKNTNFFFLYLRVVKIRVKCSTCVQNVRLLLKISVYPEYFGRLRIRKIKIIYSTVPSFPGETKMEIKNKKSIKNFLVLLCKMSNEQKFC